MEPFRSRWGVRDRAGGRGGCRQRLQVAGPARPLGCAGPGEDSLASRAGARSGGPCAPPRAGRMVRPGRITRLGLGVRGCGCCGTRVSAAALGRAEAALQSGEPGLARGWRASCGAGRRGPTGSTRGAGRAAGGRRAVRCAAARAPAPGPSEFSSAGGSVPGPAPLGPCGQRPGAATWLVRLVRGGSGPGPGCWAAAWRCAGRLASGEGLRTEWVAGLERVAWGGSGTRTGNEPRWRGRDLPATGVAEGHD